MLNLLEARDVKVRFRSKSIIKSLIERDDDPFLDAVCGVSLNVKPGETFAIVGESGSGKTTLARAITGLVKAQEGSIRYLDKELIGLSSSQFRPLRRDIAMMFQDPIGSLSPRLTVESLITEPFKIHGVKVDDYAEEARRLLSMVGLPAHFASRYPFQLSGGQARRVGVARALALSPKLIVADEPTAGLDVSVQGEILNLLAKLQSELGLSLLIITHNLSVVRHISDRMGIMYLGRFIEQGNTDDIFEQAKHPYTQALLSANHDPDPDAHSERIELQGEVPSLLQRPMGCEFHTRCPHAKDICRTQVPEMRYSTSGHQAQCHLIDAI
ncbi:peptide ABC transporter ATP-binding protein [Marinomonas sp. S3726]|uniref:ABC transporter ATP-binding protein n=1 Tax=Marinomonas sp. S3726 TaxID=579484 RepID=UPI0006200406|nr:ABC transporter ATP-binding protein [Marinomonas sp. S3726]KJZ14300.1 peptide ABC transporter ATP-binding protein [Marinomonas sp. S3726]